MQWAAPRDCALPRLQATAVARVGSCRSLRRAPAAQGLGFRGFKPGVRPVWGPPRCSGSAHRCQDWQARRRCSWLCLPALPAPSLFSHPLFRRHELQLLQSVKNVKDILQRQEGVTTFTVLGPFWRFSLEPLTSTGAPSNSERKKSQSGGELKCSPLAAPSQAAFRERDNRRSSLGSFCRPP